MQSNPARYSIRSGVIALLWLILSLPAQADNERTLLVMGDSISAAYGMSLEEGWVALMARRIAGSHPNYTVINASISGETSEGAKARLPALLEKHQPAVVILELGGNDGLRGYPTNRLRGNLAAMAKQSKDAGAHVIVVPMEIPPNYGARYAKAFRQSFIDVADASEDYTLATFLLQGVATEASLMQLDGIHPTAQAQPKLLANILPTVMEVLP